MSFRLLSVSRLILVSGKLFILVNVISFAPPRTRAAVTLYPNVIMPANWRSGFCGFLHGPPPKDFQPCRSRFPTQQLHCPFRPLCPRYLDFTALMLSAVLFPDLAASIDDWEYFSPIRLSVASPFVCPSVYFTLWILWHQVRIPIVLKHSPDGTAKPFYLFAQILESSLFTSYYFGALRQLAAHLLGSNSTPHDVATVGWFSM